jgi:tetratricopeptide (TPR) repeat protein
LTGARGGPYIPTRRSDRIDAAGFTPMSIPMPTTLRFSIALASALVALCSLCLYIGGCSSSADSAARNRTALDSYVQGVKAYNKGDTDAAMSSLQQAISKQNDLIMARSILGDLYRARSDYDAAKEQYQVLTTLDPYDYFNYYRLGLVYQLVDQLTDAATQYLKALSLKPDDAKSNTSLGTVYLGLDKPREALVYVRKGVQHDPNNAAAWVSLGLVLDKLENHAESEIAYRKALDLDSNLTLVRLYLGESLLSQKKFGEARSALQELIKVEDTPLHRKRLGDAYAGEGKFEEAIEQYRAAVKLEPNYYYALNEMGAAYIRMYEKGLTLDDSLRKAALEAWGQSLAIRRAQPKIIEHTQKWSKAVSIPR